MVVDIIPVRAFVDQFLLARSVEYDMPSVLRRRNRFFTEQLLLQFAPRLIKSFCPVVFPSNLSVLPAGVASVAGYVKWPSMICSLFLAGSSR